MTTSGPADWTQAAGGPSPLPVLGMCILAAVSTDVCSQFLSCVQLLATPWTVTHQALLSTAILRQEYWSGLPLPSPGNLPDPGIEPTSPALQVDSSPLSHLGSPTNKTNNLTTKERQKTYRNMLSTVRALACTRFHVSRGTSAHTVP